jgi:hypothetical protein
MSTEAPAHLHVQLHRELEQCRALAPLLREIPKLLEFFKEDDGSFDHFTPAVYLELRQWRRISEAFKGHPDDMQQYGTPGEEH